MADAAYSAESTAKADDSSRTYTTTGGMTVNITPRAQAPAAFNWQPFAIGLAVAAVVALITRAFKGK